MSYFKDSVVVLPLDQSYTVYNLVELDDNDNPQVVCSRLDIFEAKELVKDLNESSWPVTYAMMRDLDFFAGENPIDWVGTEDYNELRLNGLMPNQFL